MEQPSAEVNHCTAGFLFVYFIVFVVKKKKKLKHNIFKIGLVCDAARLIWFLFVPFQKSWQPDEDVSDGVPPDRTLKSVTFQETVNVISASPAVMELESQQIQHGCLNSPTNRQRVAGMQEPQDGVVVQVRFLDENTTIFIIFSLLQLHLIFSV